MSMNDNNLDASQVVARTIDKCIEVGTFGFLSIHVHNNRGNEYKCSQEDRSHCYEPDIEGYPATRFITLVAKEGDVIPAHLMEKHKHDLECISAVVKLRAHFQHPSNYMNYPHINYHMRLLLDDFGGGKPEKYIRQAKIYLSLVMGANKDFDTTQDPCLLDIVQSMTGGEQIRIYEQYESKLEDVVAEVEKVAELDTHYGACRNHLLSGKLFNKDIARMRWYLYADELYSRPRQI